MKLIDLLVQELPKRGGWPDGAEIAVQDADYQLCFSAHSEVSINNEKTDWLEGQWGGGLSNPYLDDVADDRDSSIVTRDQYESALAALQKPAWNGEGIPPVGCECECEFLDAWHVCKILFVGAEVIVGVIDDSERAFSVNHTKFRPLQSEAKKEARSCSSGFM